MQERIMISLLKRLTTILLIALLLVAIIPDAKAQRDRLLVMLATAENDSIKIKTYAELARYYLNHREPDSCILYAERGLALAKSLEIIPDIELYRLKLNALDAKYEYKTAVAQIPPILEILKNSKKAEDKVWLLLFDGWYRYRMGEFSKAIDLFEAARLKAQELGVKEVEAEAYLGLGRVYYNLRELHMEAVNYEYFLDLVDKDRHRHLVFVIMSRLGDVQREQEEYDKGIKTYKRLIKLAEAAGDSLRVANTMNRIAWGYYQKGDLENSLEYYLKDLELSKQINHKNLIVNCLGNIGNIYRDWNYYEKAIEYYNLSIEVSKEIDDFYNLSWLYKDISAMYANMGRFEKAYDHFMLHSAYNDSLMSEDYNRRILEAQTRYEREKSEKEMAQLEISLQRNRYFLWGFGGLSLVVIFIAILLIRAGRLRSQQRLDAMNHRISNLTQKNLRAQMNPHFIFNTLNSIQYYVFQNDRIASNDYMTKFAKLIRKTLENSEQPAIPIDEEIDALKLYLELESLRFKKKFDWKIEIDEDIDTYMYKIPTMLIQPFVENSIGHGLMHKDGKGYINIDLKLDTDSILCSIEDNGVGRAKAMEIKNGKSNNHKSLGTSITESRLKLVNSLYGKNMKVDYTDLKDDEGNASGTRVVIRIPIIT
jgi:tetratricopeptide (TPR) repeat protein